MADGAVVTRILHADYLLSGDSDAIRDGAVVVDELGAVLDAGPAGALIPAHAGTAVQRLQGVLSPGLVNAHTHVELCALRGKVAGGAGFVPWLERFVGIRQSEEPEIDLPAIEQGARELFEAGTAAVGDVSNTGAAAGTLAAQGIGGVVFLELFGMDRERAGAGVDAIARNLEKRERVGDLVFSAAPHTLYTTHPDAVRRLLDLARGRGLPSSIHLAEHAAERTLLEQGSGPFADFARRLRFFSDTFPIPGRGPVEVAASIGALAPDVLLVHLTDARPPELERIAGSGAPVALCPRSNLYIQVRLPPLLEMLKAGIVPALGTDSLASNLSLDVLQEAKALAERFPSVPKRVLFEMATAAGARALQRADLGRIARGTRPGILLFEGAPGEDPFGFVLTLPRGRRRWVALRGRPR